LANKLVNFFDFSNDLRRVRAYGFGISELPGKNCLHVFDAPDMAWVVFTFHCLQLGHRKPALLENPQCLQITGLVKVLLFF